MQLMVVEFARHVLGNEEVNSTEFDRSTIHPVIDLMPDQRALPIWAAPCAWVFILASSLQGSIAAQRIPERRWCRSGTATASSSTMPIGRSWNKAGLRFSGISPDGRLVEIAEMADHPFMVGTQFHPEFLSRPNRPHPLFVAFLQAVKERAHDRLQIQALAGEQLTEA